MLEKFVKIYNETNFKAVADHIEKSDTYPAEWRDNLGNIAGYQNLNVVIPKDKFIETVVNDWVKKYINLYCNDFDFKLTSSTNPRFNKYDKSHSMDSHIDHIYSCFDGTQKGIPVLSVVGLLNDNFQGGKFVFEFEKDYTPSLLPGDIMIFPSAFPWKHRVEPVTDGTRYSWVCWVW